MGQRKRERERERELYWWALSSARHTRALELTIEHFGVAKLKVPDSAGSWKRFSFEGMQMTAKSFEQVKQMRGSLTSVAVSRNGSALPGNHSKPFSKWPN